MKFKSKKSSENWQSLEAIQVQSDMSHMCDGSSCLANVRVYSFSLQLDVSSTQPSLMLF